MRGKVQTPRGRQPPGKFYIKPSHFPGWGVSVLEIFQTLYNEGSLFLKQESPAKALGSSLLTLLEVKSLLPSLCYYLVFNRIHWSQIFFFGLEQWPSSILQQIS